MIELIILLNIRGKWCLRLKPELCLRPYNAKFKSIETRNIKNKKVFIYEIVMLDTTSSTLPTSERFSYVFTYLECTRSFHDFLATYESEIITHRCTVSSDIFSNHHS